VVAAGGARLSIGAGPAESLLPWGVVRPAGGPAVCAVRVGEDRALALDGWGETLNGLIEAGPEVWADRQARAREALEGGAETLVLADCDVLLPIRVADYVDFYASLEHASFFGRLLRPEGDPLAPNWRSLPVGYHGRASTVVVDGTPVRRPSGQRAAGDVGPTRMLDIECELGFVCGPSGPGPISVDDASARIFGFVLLNDWSARDLQAFEMAPLGPFLGKSFATSVSPWIVPPEALARVAPREQDPPPPEYLRAAEPWAPDVEIEVVLNGETIARPRTATLYWTPAQMVAHATSNGAALTAGDLFGTGTISAPDPGSLTEIFEGRRFLADGDEVVLRAAGFGAVSARIIEGGD